MAFPNRLITTWRNLLSSAWTYWGKSDVRSKISSKPLLVALSWNIFSRLSNKRYRSKLFSLRVSLPDSILDIDKMSLINESKCSPDRLMIPRYSCCWVDREWTACPLGDGEDSAPRGDRSWLMSWVKPKIVLRGVRSSWLMLARNSLLARLAAALCAAALTAASL